jgi:t-SNARE complex subunit (syntaxin)
MGESPEDIELQIKQAREALAERVDALLDEVAEGTEEIKQGAERVKEGVDAARKAAVKVAVVAFVAVIGVLVIRRVMQKKGG